MMINKIDALLPQTQCRLCGYEGCYAYATALSLNKTMINRCPPGGYPVMRALAQLLNLPECALDESCGQHTSPQRAYIDETLCIGCTKCIQACPVDAIVGAKKFMHTIISDECTGCALCIPPCPLDCIDIKKIETEPLPDIGLSMQQKKRAQQSRIRFEARQKRMQQRHSISETLPPQEKKLADRTEKSSMHSLIELAKQKAKQKGQQHILEENHD